MNKGLLKVRKNGSQIKTNITVRISQHKSEKDEVLDIQRRGRRINMESRQEPVV
jgi:hypothetical protein